MNLNLNNISFNVLILSKYYLLFIFDCNTICYLLYLYLNIENKKSKTINLAIF